MENWVGEIAHIEHLDGTPWHDAPVPRRWHKCKAQSRGFYYDVGVRIERCACGGTRLDHRVWINRNTRRRAR